MADSEDSTTTLGNSEPLSVQHSPRDAIPAVNHEAEEGREGVSVVSRKDAGHVLPNHPAGAESSSKEKKLDGQVTTRVIQSSSSSGDGKGLAGGASNENVNWGGIASDPGEVA